MVYGGCGDFKLTPKTSRKLFYIVPYLFIATPTEVKFPHNIIFRRTEKHRPIIFEFLLTPITFRFYSRIIFSLPSTADARRYF